MSNKKKIIIAGIVVIFMLVILPVGKHYIIGPRYYEDEYDIGIYYKGEIYYPTSHIGAKSDDFIGMLDLGSPVYTVQNNENQIKVNCFGSVDPIYEKKSNSTKNNQSNDSKNDSQYNSDD